MRMRFSGGEAYSALAMEWGYCADFRSLLRPNLCRPPSPPNCDVHGRDPRRPLNVDFATFDRSQRTSAIRPSLAKSLSIGTRMWYHDTAHVVAQARRSVKFMPKRGRDADGRVFFDQLVSLNAACLKAAGAIRLEDRHGVIAFGDEDHGGEHHKCTSASPIRNSRTAARGATSSALGAAAGKRSSGSSTMRRAA